MLWDTGAAAAPPKVMIEGWNDGSFSRWTVGSTRWGIVSTPTYAGTAYAARRSGGTSTTGEDHIYRAGGTFEREFEPGKIYHIPVYVNGTIDILFGDQSSSVGDQYELNLRAGGPGWSVFSETAALGGGKTELGAETGPYELRQDEWIHIYIAWDPADTYSGANDPRDPDNSNVGDFLICAFADDGTPLTNKYIPANNTTFRSGGLGFAVSATSVATVDELEVGDSPDAFPLFKPNRRYGSGEIAWFNNADSATWGDLADRQSFRINSPAEVTPAGGDFCLVVPGDGTFKEMFSHPNLTADQEYPLPNYPGPGTLSEAAIRAKAATDFLATYYGSGGGRANSVRFEYRFGADRVRIIQYDNLSNVSATYVDRSPAGLTSGQWYYPQYDRRTAGQITHWIEDAGGATVFGPDTFSIPTAPANAAGIGVVGATNSADCYVDGWGITG